MQRQLSLKGAPQSVARERLCVRLFQRAELLLTLASDSIAAREQCNRWTASATWTRQHCAAEQPPLVETQISAVYYLTLFTHRLLSPLCSTGLRAKYLHKNSAFLAELTECLSRTTTRARRGCTFV